MRGMRRGEREQQPRMLDAPLYQGFRFCVVGAGTAYALSTILPFGEQRATFLDTWFYSLALVGTAMLAVARPLLVRHHRPAWLCVGLAVASWAAGDIYWSAAFSASPGDEIPVPSLADVFYIGIYPLAFAGFILLARAAVTRLPASVLLDRAVISLAAGAVFCASVVVHVLSIDSGGALGEKITYLLYPVGDLMLIIISLVVLATVRRRSYPTWWLLGLGAGFFATADTAYLFGLSKDAYVDGSWVDGLWMLGLMFMALAGSLNPATGE
ncbi:MAG TPA: hypothetical protein DGG94_13095 [Micromonosporaceae bacterium]|nr:hypothetical protein [Micromonosporaceae bacterium]HCU50716.1 hypothetical protein [Micromonosporaceae bacterium]